MIICCSIKGVLNEYRCIAPNHWTCTLGKSSYTWCKEHFPHLMPSVHLAEYYRKLICAFTWECILPIRKKNQVIFRTYLTEWDTRFQADHCWLNFFSILFLGLEFLLPKCRCQNADTKMPMYQEDGVIHNIFNFR